MTVTIEGLDRLARKLQRIGGNAILRKPMQKSVLHMHRVIAKYPPSTIANTPANFAVVGSYYKRGTGTVLPSGHIDRTSERLGSGWTTRVLNDNTRGEIGNNTTYGKWVQSGEDQTSIHRLTGWLTDDDAIENQSRTVLGFFQVAYREALNE